MIASNSDNIFNVKHWHQTYMHKYGLIHLIY